jgi:hypothetical protein
VPTTGIMIDNLERLGYQDLDDRDRLAVAIADAITHITDNSRHR